MTELLNCPLPWNIDNGAYLKDANGKTIADFRYKNGKQNAEYIISLTRAASPSVHATFGLDDCLREIDYAKEDCCHDNDTVRFERLEKIQKYLEAQASPSEWKGIESAPKDGTSILAAIRGYKTITLVYWNVHYKKWCTISENETPDFYDDVFFTLWMPLPTPPNNHNREGA